MVVFIVINHYFICCECLNWNISKVSFIWHPFKCKDSSYIEIIYLFKRISNLCVYSTYQTIKVKLADIVLKYNEEFIFENELCNLNFGLYW